jgi:hypothetical protein
MVLFGVLKATAAAQHARRHPSPMLRLDSTSSAPFRLAHALKLLGLGSSGSIALA